MCEGNLMAGRQELEKLDLMFADSHVISAEDVSRVMVQQSRYSTFQFTEEVLKGDMRKAVIMLRRLENEGIEPVVVLWSLVNEAQTLSKLAIMQQSTGRIDFKALRIWPNKQNLYQMALARLSVQHLEEASKQLSHADILFKSTYVAKPYVVLSHLALLFLPTHLSEFALDSHA